MDKTVISILGVTGLVLGAAILFSAQRAPAVQTVASDDPARPMAVVSESHFDFGRVGMNDEPTRVVTVRNDGQTPLTLSNIGTSCDCTFATITLPDGTTTPEFTMHGSNVWQGELKTGETAEVNVIYRPSVMPVKGKVSRAVSIKTNDPNQPSIQIGFDAEVN